MIDSFGSSLFRIFFASACSCSPCRKHCTCAADRPLGLPMMASEPPSRTGIKSMPKRLRTEGSILVQSWFPLGSLWAHCWPSGRPALLRVLPLVFGLTFRLLVCSPSAHLGASGAPFWLRSGLLFLFMFGSLLVSAFIFGKRFLSAQRGISSTSKESIDSFVD